MNRLNASHIITSVLVVFVQILLLKNVQIEFFDRFTLSIFIYPAVIIFFPIGMRRSALITIAFFLGLFIDAFYDSPGVHTAALVLTAFLRALVLRLLAPRQGYRTDESPSFQINGAYWLMTYLGILLFVHIFIYFSVDAFTYVFIFKIIVNTVLSFLVSYLILILYKMLI